MRNVALLIGAALAYYYWQRNKTAIKASATNAASTASRLVSNAVDQTTFIPDITTDAQRYAQEKSSCK